MVPERQGRTLPVKAGRTGRAFSKFLRTFWLLPLAVTPLVAKTHPVPLEKNVDSAKCLECHNADDNREFGGTGPNGPHGSKWTHLLERRYEFSQAPAPGAGDHEPVPQS